MNSNTRVQISEDLANVPELCVSLVENKIRRQLEIINCEVEHLLKVSRHDPSPKPESIVWHIEQARQRLFWLDNYMQDVHMIASQYLSYVQSQNEDEADMSKENLRQAVDIATGGLENEENSENKDK